MAKFIVGDAVRLVVPAHFAPRTSGTAFNGTSTRVYNVHAGMRGYIAAVFQAYYEVQLNDPTIREPVQLVEEFLEIDPSCYNSGIYRNGLTITVGRQDEARSCVCDVPTLMRGGCTCGAVTRYKPPGIIT